MSGGRPPSPLRTVSKGRWLDGLMVIIRGTSKCDSHLDAQAAVAEDEPFKGGRDRVCLRSSAARRPNPAPTQINISTARKIGPLKKSAPTPTAMSAQDASEAAVLSTNTK